MTALATTRNGKAISIASVPFVPIEELSATIATGERLAALFGAPAEGGAVELWAVLASDREGSLGLARALVTGDSYPSITPSCSPAHLFEREIAENFALRPEGHPWLKPVRFTPARREGPDAFGRTDPPTIGVMDYFRVEGDEVHEVAVGPVHAGVIEPGHFRFQCHGERVFHLEISLGYQHRGVERALVSGSPKRAVHYVETIAGDTSIGHASAYAQLVEGLASDRVPPRGQALRAIGLELERMANHTGDLGALANDVGFLPTASYCGRLRGDFLNMTAALCGNRFGRNFIRPGGVAFDVDAPQLDELSRKLESTLAHVENAVSLLWSSASVLGRFENTGRVTEETAQALGLVGYAARASGLDRDVRVDHPYGIHRFHEIPVSTWHTGDVFARAWVRWLEIRRSAAFVRELLASLPRGPSSSGYGALSPGSICVSMVEGWRGEICHVGLTDDAGRLRAYKIVDPSFHNWAGLAVALRDQAISDFPLCNKSFDLSYCGFDL